MQWLRPTAVPPKTILPIPRQYRRLRGSHLQVSAALIVRDEAAMIGGCLESLRGHVDEIVVVDTGSADATPQIVASYGARLLHHEWNGDFSAARNRALDAVSGDWILYIDADERLVPA